MTHKEQKVVVGEEKGEEVWYSYRGKKKGDEQRNRSGIESRKEKVRR